MPSSDDRDRMRQQHPGMAAHLPPTAAPTPALRTAADLRDAALRCLEEAERADDPDDVDELQAEAQVLSTLALAAATSDIAAALRAPARQPIGGRL